MPNTSWVGHDRTGASAMKDMGNTDWCDLKRFFEVWVNGDFKGRFKDEEAAIRKCDKLRTYHPERLYTIFEVTPQRVKTKSWFPRNERKVRG